MSEMERILALANLLVEQSERVKALDAELAAAKRNLLRTEREDLPQLMAEIGIQEIKLSTGQKVAIKEDVDARITDDHRPAALRWLLDNGFGGLIKTQVTVPFDRGDHDAAVECGMRLKDEYSNVTLKEDVHPMTLKAFVKEQMAAGTAVPFDLFSIFPFNKAVITK